MRGDIEVPVGIEHLRMRVGGYLWVGGYISLESYPPIIAHIARNYIVNQTCFSM